MPDGRIIAAVQSTLDIDGKNKTGAVYPSGELRSGDRENRDVRLPCRQHGLQQNSDAKIGDIVALDNHTILLIEQGEDKMTQCVTSSTGWI